MARNPGDNRKADEADQTPNVAIRRHHDRCFHAVEEVVLEGFIVQGILIPHDEVAQVAPVEPGGVLPACRLPGRTEDGPNR
jgi:hypothetical protein